uniref:Alternative protein TNS4 n=1 Tax=Homo sapiens TaxID=9606 RepID=L8E9G9_HUMAN|nr:alternative protein TNS4 [Homo sapiens]
MTSSDTSSSSRLPKECISKEQMRSPTLGASLPSCASIPSWPWPCPANSPSHRENWEVQMGPRTLQTAQPPARRNLRAATPCT